MNKILTSALAALSFTAVSLAAGPSVRKAPDLMIQAVNSKVQTLNGFKGKAVALEFILTTCSHCQESCVLLNKMYREFGSQGFMPVAVAINENSNLYIADFVKKFGIMFPVGWQRKDTGISFLQHPVMQPMMMPQIAFIDREGVIRAQFAGADKFFEKDTKDTKDNQETQMRAQIKSLLGSAPAAKKAAPAAKK